MRFMSFISTSVQMRQDTSLGITRGNLLCRHSLRGQSVLNLSCLQWSPVSSSESQPSAGNCLRSAVCLLIVGQSLVLLRGSLEAHFSHWHQKAKAQVKILGLHLCTGLHLYNSSLQRCSVWNIWRERTEDHRIKLYQHCTSIRRAFKTTKQTSLANFPASLLFCFCCLHASLYCTIHGP